MKQAAAAAAVMSRSYTGGQSSYTQQQQYPATSTGRRWAPRLHTAIVDYVINLQGHFMHATNVEGHDHMTHDREGGFLSDTCQRMNCLKAARYNYHRMRRLWLLPRWPAAVRGSRGNGATMCGRSHPRPFHPLTINTGIRWVDTEICLHLNALNLQKSSLALDN